MRQVKTARLPSPWFATTAILFAGAAIAAFLTGQSTAHAQTAPSDRVLAATAVDLPNSPAAPMPRLSPVELVERFHASVLQVSKNTDSLGYHGRRHELEKAILASFNTDAMARISVGRHWNEMEPEEQRHLSDSYVKVLSSLMADKFDFYYGQDFETVAQRPIDRNLRYVDSQLVLPRGITFPLTYVAGLIDQQWGLIDVVTPGGTSLLRVRHGEYHSVIKRQGVGGFLAALDQMVDGFDER